MEFSIGAICIILSIATSYTVSKIIKNEIGLFSSIYLGVLLLITTGSLFYTKGKTILIAGLPILLLLYFKKKNYKYSLFKYKLETFVSLFFTYCIIFYVYGFYFIPNTINISPFAFMDMQFYGDVAYSLINTGQENASRSLSIFMPDITGCSPYHYFDIWCAALIGKLFHQPYALGYMIFFTPIAAFVVFCGVAEYVFNNTQNHLLSYLGGLLLCFMPLIALTLFDAFPLLLAYKNGSVSTYFKAKNMFLTATIVYFITSIAQDKSYNISLLILLLIPVIDVSYTPIVYIAVGLLLLTKYHQARWKIKNDDLLLLGVMFYQIAFIVFLYIGNKQNLALYGANIRMFEFKGTASLTTIPKAAIGIGLAGLFYYLPVIISLTAIMKYKKIKIAGQNEILVLGVTSIIISAIMYPFINDAYQFLNIFVVITVLYSLMVLIIFVDTLKSNNRIFYLVSILFLSIFTMHSGINRWKGSRAGAYFLKNKNYYSDSYLIDLKNKISNIRSKRGICLFNYSSASFEQNIIYTFNTLGHHVKSFDNAVHVSSLSSYFQYTTIYNNKNREKYNLMCDPFCQFVLKKRQEKTFTTTEKAMAEYVRKYNISFGIIEKGAVLPQELKYLVRQYTIDSNSGEMFVLF